MNEQHIVNTHCRKRIHTNSTQTVHTKTINTKRSTSKSLLTAQCCWQCEHTLQQEKHVLWVLQNCVSSICVCVCVCICVCTCTRIAVYMMCMCVCAFMCICVFVCTCLNACVVFESWKQLILLLVQLMFVCKWYKEWVTNWVWMSCQLHRKGQTLSQENAHFKTPITHTNPLLGQNKINPWHKEWRQTPPLWTAVCRT